MATELHVSSDYAVMGTGDIVFYYGYEWGRDHDPDHDPEEGDRYGFTMTVNGVTVCSLAREDDGTGMEAILLRGIGHCIAKGLLGSAA